MKSIAYIIPYFGKLPQGFQAWLLSCSFNPTVDWIMFTDDHTNYNYPSNVKVNYQSFESMKQKIKGTFDFPIILNRPWKLCDFRPAYGDIFKEELKAYDFWGHCDIDLVWGDIRKFITDEILDIYDKVGFQGHSSLYRNCAEVNSRYKISIPSQAEFTTVFSESKSFLFDENGICSIYNYVGIPYFKETNFAHLAKYEHGFFLGHMPDSVAYKNKHQIFVWEDGKIHRYYYRNQILLEEFMYIHFFCRPMKYKAIHYETNTKLLMYPDILEELKQDVNPKMIVKLGRNDPIHYYVSSIWYNRKKLTFRRIIGNVQRMLKYKLK